jgi:hypothetical protein
MALKDTWVDKVDGVDVNSAEDINSVAHAVIDIEENGVGSGVDVTAKAGQTIIVKEVDKNGKPTAWASVDYQPRTHWKESDSVVLPETTVEIDPEEGAAAFPYIPFSVDKTYTVRYNGVDYFISNVLEFDGQLVLGNGSAITDGALPNTGEPFAFGSVNFDGEWYSMLIPLDGSTTVTISIVTDTAHKIPEEYLPNPTTKIVEVYGHPAVGNMSIPPSEVVDAINENIDVILVEGKDINKKYYRFQYSKNGYYYFICFEPGVSSIWTYKITIYADGHVTYEEESVG